MRKDFYRNLPLWVFGGITATGCVFVTATKMLGVPPYISMLIPVALMIAYWFVASRTKRIRLHDEQTGDNLYYMGFLFTLTSLGVSLYQFTSDSSTDDVVRNFGVAISSTIVGIAMRIMYNQSRRDAIDVERTTRQDLATMTRLVRAEMESARRELADFRRINMQMISEGFNEIIETSEKTTKMVQSSLEKMVEDTIKPVAEAGKSFTGAIDVTMGNMSSRLADVSNALDTSLEKIQTTAKSFENVKLPEDVIKNELVPIVKDLGRLCSELASKGDAMTREQSVHVKGITEGVGKLAEQVTRTMGLVEKSVQATAAVIQRMDASRLSQRPLQVTIPQPAPAVPSRPAPGFQTTARVAPVHTVQPSATPSQFARLPETQAVGAATPKEPTTNVSPSATIQQTPANGDKWSSWYNK
ncbi:hypothetical protein IB276_18415 [Ensifer sp. ENS04]|uniref:hypothetical protein n=1 Tax=Ensifer sp. ENS04 TaxID=2769281 RepID=UPI00178557D6|nr:hypothetical protein [Ensifer sp. ENS04]MBD9541431.1 hypothetical protein [Ensifer sp. ENS04]